MADWKEAIDPRTGRTYYANIRTKQTVWKIPPELRALRRKKKHAEEEAAPPPPPPQAEKAVPDELGDWKVRQDVKTGKKYFYNPKSGETSWKRPLPSQSGNLEHTSTSVNEMSDGSLQKEVEFDKACLLVLNGLKVVRLRDQLRANEMILEKKRDELLEERNALRLSQLNVQNLRSDLAAEKNKAAQRMKNVEASKRLFELNVNRLRDENQDLGAEVATLKEQIQKNPAKAELREVKMKFTKLTEELKEAKRKAVQAESDLKRVTRERDTAEKNAKLLQLNLKQVKDDIARALETKKASEEQRERLERQLTEMKGKLQMTEGSLSQLRNELSQSLGSEQRDSANMEQVRKQLAEKTNETRLAVLQTEKMDAQVKHLTAQLNTFKHECTQWREKVAELEAQIKRQDLLINDAKNQSEFHANEARQAHAQITQLEMQLTASSHEVARVKTQKAVRRGSRVLIAPGVQPAPKLPTGLAVPQKVPQPQKVPENAVPTPTKVEEATDAELWEEHVDPATGNKYYFSRKSNITQWTRPSGNSVVKPVEPPKDEWEELTDPSTGRKYYYNIVRMETTWEPPPGFLPEVKETEDEKAAPSEGILGGHKKSVKDKQRIQRTLPSAFQGESKEEEGRMKRSDSGESIPGRERFGSRGSFRSRSFSRCPTASEIFELSRDAVQEEATFVVHDKNEKPQHFGLDFVQKHSMENYATEHFHGQKKGLFGKQTLQDMVSHSSKGISHSLNKLEKPLNSSGMQTFRNITSYMGLRKSSKKPLGHVAKLTKIGIHAPAPLRDEIFCQLIKQCTQNPSEDQLVRGWKLMCLLAGIFAPSEMFLNYLLTFCQLNEDHSNRQVSIFSRLTVQRVRRSIANGPRKMPPSAMEIEMVERGRDIVLPLYFPDGQCKFVAVQSQTRAVDLINCIVADLSLPNDKWPRPQTWELVQVITSPDAPPREMALLNEERVLDVREQFHQQHPRTKKKLKYGAPVDFKFVFKPRLFLTRQMQDLDKDALHLYFSQAVVDIVGNQYGCDPEIAVQLAILQIRATHGTLKEIENPKSFFSDENLPSFLPRSSINRYKLELDKVRQKLKDGLKAIADRPQVECKLEYLKIVEKNDLYGCTFFPVEMVLVRSTEEAVLGVSESGIFILHPITREISKKVVKLEAILEYGVPGDTEFYFTTGTALRPKTMKFNAMYPHRIKELVKIYKEEMEALDE